MRWEDTGAMPEAMWCEKLELLPDTPPYDAAMVRRIGVSGLQVGSLDRRHPACLNADLCGLMDLLLRTSQMDRISRVDGKTYFVQLDATRPLPFADATFDWVYAEHFIEHITLREGVAWLKEARRVLKPGGFARLTTPDLRRYAAAYLAADDSFFAAHRERILRMGFPAMESRRAWMVNQLFQFWGHKWIYDLEELRHLAAAAGFPPDAFQECAFGQGRDPSVAGLDFDLRSDETLYVELSA